ncbi:hypothetical protein Srufu_046030 [Streptomyces libani subsp. rufus]|nr:hypothetical protein Srufu_046030 [Streptomyces libani subsp. rufus]
MLIGLLLGALGGGGSVLAVPALVYLLGQSPHEATAGALVVVTVGAVTGLLCHGRAGRVRWAAGAAFGALGTAGSYLGSRWSAALDPTVLMAAFAGLLLVVAAMLVSRGRGERRAAAETRPSGEPREGTPSRDAPEAVPLRGPGEGRSLAEPGKTPASPESAEAAVLPAPEETLSPPPAETLPSQKPSETAPLRDTAIPTPSDKMNGPARPAPRGPSALP